MRFYVHRTVEDAVDYDDIVHDGIDDAVTIDSDSTVHLEKRPVPLRQARKRFDPAPDAAVQSDCCFRRVQIQGDITDNILELLCGVVCDLDSVDFS